MFSLRQQLAARLPDWVDHAYSIFHPSWNPVWGDVVPAPAVGAVAAGTRQGAAAAYRALETPPPAFHLMRICPVCQAGVNVPCITGEGRVTRPHKARRQP